MRNLLAGDPAGNRPKVLMLGISYPSVSGQMEEKGYEPDLLTNKTPSVDQSVEVVRRKIMTEMDGRDLARIVATEQACGIDAYTVSKEIGCVYRSDRHLHANFNARNFVQKLKESFGDDVQFSQVILDYYWMPTGWLVTRWAKTLFQKTLPNLVKERILTYPSTRGRRMRKKGDEIEEGVVYLPFCAHVCKELVGGIDTLKDYYSITFVKKSELPGHSLWKGTMDIDADTMQTRLGKRLDQEEVYCTFRPKDIYESMEDSHVSKPAVMRILMAIEDYENIRMIRLRPLRQHEPPSVLKERLLKPEIGGFKGLNFDLVNQKRKLAEEVAAAKAEKQKLEKQKKAVKVSSAKATSAPPKRKTEKQESAQPKKKAKETLKDKGPLYEEVEQLDACNIPHVTYFYPCPAIDLDTYNEPEEKRKASKKISQAKKPNEPEQQVFWIRQPLSKSPKKTTRSQKVLNLKKEPHKYLSYNPRCRKETNSEEKGGPGSAVLEITVPYVKTLSLGDKLDQERELFLQRERELDSNQTLVVDGACTLFDLRNNVSSISSSQVQEGEQQLSTCQNTCACVNLLL